MVSRVALCAVMSDPALFDPVPFIDVGALEERFERLKNKREVIDYDDLKRYDGETGLSDDTYEGGCCFPEVDRTTAKGVVSEVRSVLIAQFDFIMPRPEVKLQSGAKCKAGFFSLSELSGGKRDSLSIECCDANPMFPVVYLNIWVAGSACIVEKGTIIHEDEAKRTFEIRFLFRDAEFAGTLFRKKDEFGRRNLQFVFGVEPGTVGHVLDVIGTVICLFEPKKKKN
jgi:hypothetical protein